MSPKELLADRYEVVADYPLCSFKIGEILTYKKLPRDSGWYGDSPDYYESSMDYPHLFRKMNWWEKRSLEDLKSVKFVKVIKYRGYWRVGDIVAAKFHMENDKPLGYTLGYDHWQPVFELLPSDEQEYNEYKSPGA